ncbi:MAG TPA: winged helix-turn-helix domain-containing protein [Rhizomicrobium sp.]|jgi:DNA-binding transcriptional ArsR family regulator
MKLGPGIAATAALIGDPARANMLTALLDGGALTASELALEAGVTKQTASSHLSKLTEGGLLRTESQGRHRYYALADGEVAGLLESLMGVAARRGPSRVRTGPKEPALRRARICYDHLAGELGVALYDGLMVQRLLAECDGAISLTARGQKYLAEFGVEIATGPRPLCRACLDWSARRHHLAGAAGAALLDRIFALRWARRVRDSRIVEFTTAGESAFRSTFSLAG